MRFEPGEPLSGGMCPRGGVTGAANVPYFLTWKPPVLVRVGWCVIGRTMWCGCSGADGARASRRPGGRRRSVGDVPMRRRRVAAPRARLVQGRSAGRRPPRRPADAQRRPAATHRAPRVPTRRRRLPVPRRKQRRQPPVGWTTHHRRYRADERRPLRSSHTVTGEGERTPDRMSSQKRFCVIYRSDFLSK